MNGKILVTYATRTGSTVGVAAAIGETISGRGYTVDVRPMREDPDPEGYDAVVLGSAINGANWLPEAVEYVRAHQDALARSAVALFCVHIMNSGDDETSVKRRQAYLKDVRPLVRAADEAFFTGMGMDAQTATALERWVYRTFKVGAEGDCRDWNVIQGWAQQVRLTGLTQI